MAAECNIDTESPSFQDANDVVLDRNKPLVAAGVKNGDELELVSAEAASNASATLLMPL
jgi:hypothetical protein